MEADTLIHARWIIPVEPAGKRLEHHALAITDGRILALLPSEEARQQIEATEVVELPGHALIPGLVNAHTHTPMTLFRGLADDLPLMEWLQRHIWPAEQQWVSRDFVAAGSRLAMAEMIRGGTTCFNDMYFFPDVTAQVAHQAGLRAAIGMILIDFPSAWASDADDPAFLQRRFGCSHMGFSWWDQVELGRGPRRSLGRIRMVSGWTWRRIRGPRPPRRSP